MPTWRPRRLCRRGRSNPARGCVRVTPRWKQAAMSVVEISGVSKRFGATTALEGIELEIGEREFVSLIGPSGCGKSTLLRIIGDLIDPSGGKIVVNGKTARQARKDRDYGIIFPVPVLYDWRTVAKDGALPLEWEGCRRQNGMASCRPRAGLPRCEGL